MPDDANEHALYRYERSGGEYAFADSHAFMLEEERSLLPGLVTDGPYVVITRGHKPLTYVRSDVGNWSMVPETVDHTEKDIKFYNTKFTMYATGRSATMFVLMSTYNLREGMVAVYTRDAGSDWQLESSIGPVRDDRADVQNYAGEVFASLDKDTVFVTEQTDDFPSHTLGCPEFCSRRGRLGRGTRPHRQRVVGPEQGTRSVSALAISSRGAFAGQSSAAVNGTANAGAVVGVLTAPPHECPDGDRSLCVAGEIYAASVTQGLLRGLESATLDAALLDPAGGAEALVEILELVCGGACQLRSKHWRSVFAVPPSSRCHALAAALRVTDEEVAVRASDGEVVVEYAATGEAGAEGDALTEEEIEALGRVRALVDTVMDAAMDAVE
ncbi:Hypothetical Protein FCC1311_020962 [Hondaea fermentalgiana]|uniref:Uncharacterized protein n=1 Tax=Hondaea fermentalgiana TaxID=2315210 RepID=A0A2R5G4C6_9STRA|nr:Hypothetical Protein FCC1311_020962 [Hondaea fermentalgiana]|eukprot:GBG25877.1 Hypothetical Protein FCC1311_020962 [Hondaea fermentalgiana]